MKALVRFGTPDGEDRSFNKEIDFVEFRSDEVYVHLNKNILTVRVKDQELSDPSGFNTRYDFEIRWPRKKQESIPQFKKKKEKQ